MKWLYYAITASLFWGLCYTLCGQILTRISTATLIAIEMLFGFLIFSMFFFFSDATKDVSVIINDKKLLVLLILEILVFILGNYFTWQTVKLAINPGLAALVESIYPVFAILFSYLFFRVLNINLYTIIGCLLILFGIIIIRTNASN